MNRLVPLFTLLWIPAALAAPIDVRTASLGDVLAVPVYSAPATVKAHNEPQISAEIAARVIALPVQIGDRVSANDILVRLDCSSHESRLAVAHAELEITRAQQAHTQEQLKRANNLNKNKSISAELLGQRRMELGMKQAEVTARQEAVKQASIDTGHCEIKAPFDAVVMDKMISVGTFVSRGTTVMRLLEASGQEVSASLRETEVARLQQANELAFEGAGGSYPVRLRALLPALNPVTRAREARLVFIAEAALPGTAGRLVWRGGRQLMPADYLVRRDDRLGVFVLNEDRAHFVAIPLAQEGRPVRVDLAPDTRLITDGRQRLVDGDEVSIVPARDQP